MIQLQSINIPPLTGLRDRTACNQNPSLVSFHRDSKPDTTVYASTNAHQATTKPHAAAFDEKEDLLNP